jgi:hypothetical protein
MELVPSDLLKHSVDLTLRKLFRIIRSVKSASLQGLDVDSPESCAIFFTESFEKTSNDLSDHATMSQQDLFYRVMLSRSQEATSGARVEAETTPKGGKAPAKPAVIFVEPAVYEKPVGPTKVCSGHLGKQLSAVRKDRRPYACTHGKDCTFVHISIARKSDQKLLEVAATMPPPMKQDITKAITSKK